MSKRLIYILAGAIVLGLAILIGVGMFVILPALNSTSNNHPTTGTSSQQKKVHHTSGLTKALKKYSSTIKSQIAQALHLSSSKLKKQLRAGKTLNDVATTQGLSTDQLSTIIHDAFQSGLQPAVTAGTIKQMQIDDLIKTYQTNQKSLEVFLGAGKKAA